MVLNQIFMQCHSRVKSENSFDKTIVDPCKIVLDLIASIVVKNGLIKRQYSTIIQLLFDLGKQALGALRKAQSGLNIVLLIPNPIMRGFDIPILIAGFFALPNVIAVFCIRNG